MPERRRLNLDLAEIGEAMDWRSLENRQYLDTETGELLILPPEMQDERVLDDAYAAELPAWERELLAAACAIVEEDGRYVSVPEIDSGEVYDLMVEFAGSVGDRRLRERLDDALAGRGAFGRFKRVLGAHPEEEERWFRMHGDFLHERAREWLDGLGIEPVADPSGPEA